MLTLYFRWQDYGEGVQLLDALCRQISQKERRIKVVHIISLHNAQFSQ